MSNMFEDPDNLNEKTEDRLNRIRRNQDKSNTYCH